MPAADLAYIPSPSANGLHIGPLDLHVYGLLIAVGVAAAVWLAQRLWNRMGGAPGTMTTLAVWGVPGGLIGARLYSLATSWTIDTGGHWYRAFAIWDGGLGIWGGVLGGVGTGLIGLHRLGLRRPPALDCAAPALAIAQAIGRWGNYANQELYGRPTHLPWAVHITHNPAIPGVFNYQPTFLYESLWDLIVTGLLLSAFSRGRLRRGYLLALYAALYTFGRFWTEYLRIDEAHKIGPLRLNDWVSVLVFLAAVALLVVRGRPGPGDERVGQPLTSADTAGHPVAAGPSPA